MDEYQEFLNRKAQRGADAGFEPLWVPDFLYDFQASLTDWAIRQGRGAVFADCGLGKSVQELVWAENVVRKTNRPVLIFTPLAVARQMVQEGEKFGIEVTRSGGGSPGKTGVYVTNYEKIHLHSASDWAGVVCDESSAIKNFNGKRRKQVTEFLRVIPYRLLATATAAPNDYIELGTSSEALGVMGHMDMLGRFFRNERNTCDSRSLSRRPPAWGGPKSTGWRFKGHASEPFWRWVCSWARACRRPSDLGFDDARFELPPLEEREHVIETNHRFDGELFARSARNFREERKERRETIQERCELAASLVADSGEQAVVWCHLNDEGDLLEKLIPGALQVAGRHADEIKEERYEAFQSGELRVLVSKPKLGAWGLNWQNCAHVVTFASHSYESYYQSVRRCWRFGQTRPVVVDLIATEGERGIKENMQRKSRAADEMFAALVRHMGDAMRIDASQKFDKEMGVPSWLSK